MLKTFIRRHWRGELSLPVSYWLIGTVLGTAVVLLTFFLVDWVDSLTPSITFTAWLVLLMYPAIWALMLWIYVGIWNSSTNYTSAGKSKVWGYLAKFGVIVGLLQFTTQVLTEHLPVMGLMKQFVMGSDSMGTVSYEVLNDGRTLYIKGFFGNGSSSIILDALKRNPSVKRLHLNSNGGRLKEVILLSREIQTRKLETYVEERCLSFCTVIFLAGSPRYSTPNAQIGFHSPTFIGDSRIDAEMMDEARELYRSFNLPESFVRKIFATSNSDMWYPSHQELIASGVVTDSTIGGASNRLQKSLNINSEEDLKKVLLSQPLWQKYEKKFPGVVDEASSRMFRSIRAGQSDADVMYASRTYIAQYQIRVIAKSTPEIRARFITLAVDQSRYVATLGPQFCGAFIASKLDITKTLPKALVDREIKITSDALDSEFTPPTNYTKTSFEKYLAQATYDMSTAEIDAVSKASLTPTEATCSGLVKFYEGIAMLPTVQRDIVTYGLFSQ